MITAAGLLAFLGIAFVFLRAQGSSNATAVVDWRGKPEVTIVLTDRGFEPDSVRIDIGTEVLFTTTRKNQFWPASNPHPTHAIYAAFDSQKPINPSESWSFTFDTAGAWGFHDHIRSYFTGTIYVDE